jgi:hypothetical protein
MSFLPKTAGTKVVPVVSTSAEQEPKVVSALACFMPQVDLPCWIGVGPERLMKGRLVAISEKGARVSFSETTNLPPICDLFLNSDRSDGHQCMVDEQTGLLARLKFLR